MKKYAYTLTCCSTADLSPDYFEKRMIPYICFHFTLDGREYRDDLGQTVPFPEFYDRIRKGSMPTTSQVSIGEFIDFWTPFLERGEDILHISGSYQAAEAAKEELQTLFADRTICVVDSLAASSGYGLLVDMAADLRDEGWPLDEAYSEITRRVLYIQQYCSSADLTHYKRGGRISATTAIIGNLLNICPIVKMSTDGKLTPYTKIRGKKNALKAMYARMKDYAADRLNYAGKCFICHSDCYEDARFLADLIEDGFPRLNGEVLINSIGTVIGSHTGPGTVGLFFYGDRRVD